MYREDVNKHPQLMMLSAAGNITGLLAQISNPAISYPSGLSGVSFFQDLLSAFLGIGFVFGALIFVVVIIVGAISWITAGGDKAQLENAKKRIFSAIAGILILFVVYAVVNLLGCIFRTNLLGFHIGPLNVSFVGSPLCPSGGGGTPGPGPGSSGTCGSYCNATTTCSSSLQCTGNICCSTASGSCPCGQGGYEICWNGVDDDSNGWTDCADPACGGQGCGPNGAICQPDGTCNGPMPTPTQAPACLPNGQTCFTDISCCSNFCGSLNTCEPIPPTSSVPTVTPIACTPNNQACIVTESLLCCSGYCSPSSLTCQNVPPTSTPPAIPTATPPACTPNNQACLLTESDLCCSGYCSSSSLTCQIAPPVSGPTSTPTSTPVPPTATSTPFPTIVPSCTVYLNRTNNYVPEGTSLLYRAYVSNFPVGSNISVAWSSTFTAVATVNPAVDNTWQYETQVTALALGKAAITAIGYVDGTAGCYASALLQVCSNAGTACVNSYDCCSAVCTRGTCQ